MTAPEPAILTIGHSNHAFEAFLELLRMHGVTTCVDVRSAPRSRRLPHFDRERLRDALAQHGIAYLFLGRELGGRPSDPACYEEGQVRYAKLGCTPLFQTGLEQLIQRASAAERPDRPALLCAEREPLECHRTLLIARELEARGCAVSHIHADGQLETQQQALSRLLVQLQTLPDLFRTRAQAIDEACALWERRIAYVEE
jgi:uncharacterized protein (DUF488 family)